MTLSDIDLEARLRRDLRARADETPPAPRDLAALTRARHRILRRREYGLAAAAVAAVLVLVGVPVVASTFAADPDRSQTARPGDPLPPDEAIYRLPTRGGLADEEDWLADVAALPWESDQQNPYRDPGMDFRNPAEPTRETRRVAYADDVPSGRVALVVGLSGRQVVHTWFVGPRGADADEMSVANYPGMYGTDVVGLVDGEAGADRLTLVVVANPEDVVHRPLTPVVAADGTVTRESETLDLDDGIAVLEVDRRWAESSAMITVERSAGTSIGVSMSDSSRVNLTLPDDPEPADPRGQGADVQGALQSPTGHLVREFGLTAEEADPTLLALGPLSDRRSAELVGMTFPSGATGMWLSVFEPDLPDNGLTMTELPFGPAGTDLLDRVIAIEAYGGLVVSAPAGVRADYLDASGAVLGSLPLTNGAGAGPLDAAGAVTSVRILDAAGEVVAETPIIETME